MIGKKNISSSEIGVPSIIKIKTNAILSILNELGIGDDSPAFDDPQQQALQNYAKQRLKEAEHTSFIPSKYSKSDKLPALLLHLAKKPITNSRLQKALEDGRLNEILVSYNKKPK